MGFTSTYLSIKASCTNKILKPKEKGIQQNVRFYPKKYNTER